MPADAPGSYWIAQLDGRDVAAVAPAGGSTATWNTYIAVDDADRTAEAAAAAGGRITDAPEDAGPEAGGPASSTRPAPPCGSGRPAGAPAPRRSTRPEAWNFSDLHTSDTRRRCDLLRRHVRLGRRRPRLRHHVAAAGLRRAPRRHHRSRPSSSARTAIGAPPGFADCVAWLAPLGDGEAPHWHVTFTVDDRDDAMATALRLGATDLSGPVDTEWTKSVTIRDPQGAVLTLSQFDPQSS